MTKRRSLPRPGQPGWSRRGGVVLVAGVFLATATAAPWPCRAGAASATGPPPAVTPTDPGTLNLQTVPPLAGVVVQVDGATGRSDSAGQDRGAGTQLRRPGAADQGTHDAVSVDRTVTFDRFRGEPEPESTAGRSNSACAPAGWSPVGSWTGSAATYRPPGQRDAPAQQHRRGLRPARSAARGAAMGAGEPDPAGPERPGLQAAVLRRRQGRRRRHLGRQPGAAAVRAVEAPALAGAAPVVQGLLQLRRLPLHRPGRQRHRARRAGREHRTAAVRRRRHSGRARPPPGKYTVRVYGGGLSFPRPLSVSKDQLVRCR